MKKMYRFIFLLCLTLGGVLSGTINAKAQWVVADPTNFLGNLINSGVEVAKAVEQFGVAKEQFDHLKKVYEQVSPYIATYYKGREALEVVNDIRSLGSSIITAYGGENYLTSAEKIYLVRMQTYYLMEASKELKNITNIVSPKGVVTASSDTDRLKVMNESFDNLLSFRAHLRHTKSKMANLSYSRRQEYMARKTFMALRNY